MSRIATRARPHRAISAADVCTMAGRLIVCYGSAAFEVASYHVEENRILGDRERAVAWRAVCVIVAAVLSGSMPAAAPTVH